MSKKKIFLVIFIVFILGSLAWSIFIMSEMNNTENIEAIPDKSITDK